MAATSIGGFHLNPLLPEDFDSTPNRSRPESHLNWWCVPYIVAHHIITGTKDGDTCYEVRRLDGGAWDRSTHHGGYYVLDEAVARCREIAHDEVRYCPDCQATTLQRYWGPMVMFDGGQSRPVEMCPVCGTRQDLSQPQADETNQPE